MEKGISKNQILSELSRSPHGKLSEYIPVGKKATKQEPEFMAHLIAWNQMNGQVRDSKVVLPLISLPDLTGELADNSWAHIATLGPRELLRAFRFAKEVPGFKSSKKNKFIELIHNYLRKLEDKGWSSWQHVAILHKHTLRELYALSYTKPGNEKLNIVLFGRKYDKTKAELPKGSIFEKVAHLKDMSPQEAAGVIMDWKIPYLIAKGALGVKAKDPDIVLALLKTMSPTEVITNTKSLEKLGIKDNPALRGAFEAALGHTAKSTKNILKTTRAAEQITDEKLKKKLQGVQDKQLESMKVEGNWLVLADRSGSMREAINIAREVSALLAKMVKGKVWLVFFDTSPQTIDVTGCSLDAIKKATQHIGAGGSTSIGCGLQRMLDTKEIIDGIAIVSDAGENATPYFPNVYKKYCEFADKEVPVYLYLCDGDNSMALVNNMKAVGQDIQVFDMNSKADYYSLPNLVTTMRTNRYSLIDEIMETKLLKLSDIFKQTKKEVEVAV